ncbi:hypothetical protein [Candidatus Nanohalobium constans]|uniref:Uncharacterized protein n=1 Tax=Candidatus Nanohalobium constans TaxID=2565781 RepID=A0A5Q0UFB9_9ARCH|nr:hypothetical protein [Candidatus Nanohalobium constans]QGA80204.1 hypothetical protein LC1Nh_0301 [Candidatus Nanohalobium constans]
MSEVEFGDDYVRIPKKEYEAMKATIETLEDEEVMEQLKASQEESSKNLDDLKEEVNQ